MRNILREADEAIHGERVARYGRAPESYARAAEVVTKLLDPVELAELAAGRFPPSVLLKGQVAIKLVRDLSSPDEPDHLRDACGLLGILDELRQGDDNGQD